MTISSTTNRVSYQGNGTTAALSFPYAFLATTDLVVIETVIATGAQTTKALGTDYTVTGTPDATGAYPNGGSVVPVVAVASTLKWTIYRDPPATQTQAAVDNDPLPAALINSGLDKLTMLSQRTRDLVTRSMRLSDGDVSGASVTMPTPVASTLLGWAADGMSIINYVAASLSGSIVTAFSSTLLALSDAASWRSALGLGTFADTAAANTFTANQTVQLTDAGATEGPVVTLDRLSASPAASDLIGALHFDGRNDSAAQKTYAELVAAILDPVHSTEDAQLLIKAMVAGALTTLGTWGPGLQIGTPTGGDKGAGTINAAGHVYENGVRIGNIAQIVNTETGAVATGTTVIPADDTIPQNTEGDQYMSLAITPTSASSTLLIDVVVHLSNSSGSTSTLIAALFRDSTANALAVMGTQPVAASPSYVSFRHKMTAGTTSATTFKVRAGGNNAGTTTFNGVSSARLFGGVLASSITITEVLP